MRRGGKRIGAGRKNLPYKTRQISKRVNVAWYAEIMKVIKNKIKELENGKSIS